MKKISILFAAALFLGSCNSSKKIVYLQDIETNKVENIATKNQIKVEPGDQLQIVVSCKDPELAAILNMPLVGFQAASDRVNTSTSIITYTVDQQGNIDFPIIGSVNVAGQTKEEVRQTITEMIKKAELIQDFVVTVDFANLKIYLMGEVGSPGTYTITDHNINIFQALAMGRDLTINGLRDQVYVIREENGQRISYRMDLRSKEIFNSPAYYLKQNDVVYVKPSRMRANQSTVSGNSFQNTSFWISLASIFTTIYLAFIK
ncbi:MAG: polysaccharide export protein [Paludibacteraceae bacterium]|nr:polysaccharide export protein [Paludibacteraceae bacterium]